MGRDSGFGSGEIIGVRSKYLTFQIGAFDSPGVGYDLKTRSELLVPSR
jgi:hypothetical protein